jgi:hypothetical protein
MCRATPQKQQAPDFGKDRVVSHFLIAQSDRVAYVRQVAHAVKPGGHVIVVQGGKLSH